MSSQSQDLYKYPALLHDPLDQNKLFNKVIGGRHGFESAAHLKELPNKSEISEFIKQQLMDIVLAATADKEYIHQMTMLMDNLLLLELTKQ